MITLEITSNRGLVLHCFVATIYDAAIGVLCSFGNQCIMERVLILILIISSFDFCVSEYVDVELLYLFRETFGNAVFSVNGSVANWRVLTTWSYINLVISISKLLVEIFLYFTCDFNNIIVRRMQDISRFFNRSSKKEI